MDHNGAGHDCCGGGHGGGYNFSEGSYTPPTVWQEISEFIAGLLALLPWLLGIGFFVLMAWLQATGRVH